MRIEYGRQETEAEVRTRYLKEMMRVRNVTTKQLSMMTRINIRTLERYTSGRTDTADAAGLSVALISYVLSMNAYALGGAETLKPGMVFSNNGRQVVVKKYDFALHTKHAATDAFNWSMNRKRLDAEILAKKAGVPKRVILDVISGRTNLLGMKARSLYPLCSIMEFHPYFLYGLREMSEYDAYVKSLRERRAQRKLIEEARRQAYQKQDKQSI